MILRILNFKTLLNLYRKIKWFFQHYNDISYTKKLVGSNERVLNSNEVIVPNIFLGPVSYATDSLVTSNNCDFITESRFAKAYAAAAETNPWPGFTLQWRVYIVCWFANHVKYLEGDLVECGVNTGAYSRAVIEYINFPSLNKNFYLFDTFSGLVQSQLSKTEKESGLYETYKNNYKDVFAQVRQTFMPFNVEVIRGVVPETLIQCKSEKICYLSLDMNVTEPEIAAAEYFWDKIVSGGVVILDDYGFPPHINQKKAFDDFASRKNIEILSLPTGQGIIIKK